MLGKDTIRSGFSLFGPAAQTKIRTLNLGDLQATDVPAIVMDHPTVELVSKILGEVRGIVGFPFFARYALTLDYQAKKMTFTPNKYKPKDIFETLLTTLMDREKPAARILAASGLWGIEVEKKAGDEDAGVVVTKVLPGSAAAEAGLRVGDRILTLDDYWTDTVDDCYSAAGQVALGSAVQVQVKRGDQELAVEVKPANGL
jgi:membrane-associated protease RseP (regulator of RpoE activity)